MVSSSGLSARCLPPDLSFSYSLFIIAPQVDFTTRMRLEQRFAREAVHNVCL